MDYILILERDESVHEMYLNYCQWTHNEAELTKLIKYIKMVKDEHAQTLGLNTSTFYVSEDRIPEAVVDGLMALKFSHGVPNPFFKYEGIFKCPSFLVKDNVFDDDDAEEADEYKDREHGYDSDDTDYGKPIPKRKDSYDMDLDEEPEEVDGFECAQRLSHYFRADGFSKYFENND
jgi:hypothetical protein